MTSRGTIDLFRELGLELEGRATIEGEWSGSFTELGDQRFEIAMRTPDGHGRLNSPAPSRRLPSRITQCPGTRRGTQMSASLPDPSRYRQASTTSMPAGCSGTPS